MAIILKTNKVNLFVSSVLCVLWYHSPNVLDTLHICNISWLRVNHSKTFVGGGTYQMLIIAKVVLTEQVDHSIVERKYEERTEK
jgi:hypothetical protein